MARCKGCGALLQSTDKNAAGYTPKEGSEYCQRCFRLSHYGDLMISMKTGIDPHMVLNRVEAMDAVILWVVDLFDFEAGMIDGIRNRFQELWYVTLPSMLPQLVFGAVMQIISAFTVADVSVQLCGLPSTNYAGETIVTHIMDYGTIRYEFGYACAMSVVLVLLMQASRALVTRMLSKVGS